MKVVVIMALYNRAHILRRVLDALGAQTRPPQQVVIVDDGSTDGSGDIARAWLDEVADRIPGKLRRVPNGGCGAARNRALEVADPDADAYHFLDSDDVVPPDLHARGVAALEADPGVMGASADQRYETLDGTFLKERSHAGVEEDFARWLVIHDPGILSASLVRRRVVDEFGPFPEGTVTGDDADVLFPAAGSPGARWAHLRGDPVIYGVLGDNITTPSGDMWVHWGHCHERNYPRSGVSWRVRSKRLSHTWIRGGRQFLHEGNSAAARRCFLRSLRHRPWHFDAYRWWFRTFAQRKRSK